MHNEDIKKTTSTIEMVITSIISITKRSFEKKERITKHTRIRKVMTIIGYFVAGLLFLDFDH